MDVQLCGDSSNAPRSEQLLLVYYGKRAAHASYYEISIEWPLVEPN